MCETNKRLSVSKGKVEIIKRKQLGCWKNLRTIYSLVVAKNVSALIFFTSLDNIELIRQEQQIETSLKHCRKFQVSYFTNHRKCSKWFCFNRGENKRLKHLLKTLFAAEKDFLFKCWRK